MIQTTLNKISSLMRTDRLLPLKLVGIILLCVLSGMLGKFVKKQERVLVKVRQEKDLTLQIPELEEKIRDKRYQEIVKERTENMADALKDLSPEKQIAEIQRILEGTSYRLGVYQAIINGEVYETGNQIGDFKIIDINMKSITLQNPEDKTIKQLFFPDYAEEEALKKAIK